MEKIIKLEDFNNKSLDDIIELYRSGYTLEHTQTSNIQQLQLSSIDISAAVFLGGAMAGLLLMLLLRGKLEN